MDDWKDRWVAALRSGDYTRGCGALRLNDNTFCCLGVLADLHGATWHEREDVYVTQCGELVELCLDADDDDYLPADARAWLLDDDRATRLALANDGAATGHPLSFAEISDLIESWA